MITLELGIQITRRKFIHIAKDEFGKVLYQERSISKLLRWCADNDHWVVWIEEGDHRWKAELFPF